MQRSKKPWEPRAGCCTRPLDLWKLLFPDTQEMAEPKERRKPTDAQLRARRLFIARKKIDSESESEFELSQQEIRDESRVSDKPTTTTEEAEEADIKTE